MTYVRVAIVMGLENYADDMILTLRKLMEENEFNSFESEINRLKTEYQNPQF